MVSLNPAKPGPRQSGCYLVQLKGRPGHYAQRAVPLDLQKRLGKKLWRKKAGNTLSEARLFLAAFLAETEALIQQYRGSLSPHDRERLLLRGKPPKEIFQSDYWHGSPEEAEEWSELPPVIPETVDQIIERATRLKSPATGTIREWRDAFDHFTGFTGSIYPLSATKADAIAFRDHLLSKNKISTTKKIIRFLQGHWEICVDEEVIKENIWRGVLKYLKDEEKEDKVFDPESVDPLANELSGEEKRLYYILRYIGFRIVEALGLRACDIDTDNWTIRIENHPLRKLKEGIKNASSRRMIPVCEKLKPYLQSLPDQELLFGQYLSPSKRWNTPSFIRNRLKTTPHLLRHHVITCLREGGVNECVSGDILGHSKEKNVTSSYGTASMLAMRDAVEKIY